ncbi:MAG: CPBP family intramembrane metalloprotease [Bacteroidetes bacterium]|nr:CPBP family intramembrane metalloprotease [Bacteroidota bacterium]MCL6101204.1 CPBP family intramembrane metalloprotease [Bacteroidota bacterium]
MKFLRDATPITQLLFSLIFILTGGILVSLLGFLGCWLFLGIGFEELSAMLANFNEPDNLALLKVFQVLQTIGMFILPPLALAFFMAERPFHFLQLHRKPTWIMFGVVCAIILVSGPVIEWFSIVNQHLTLPSWLNQVELWMRNSEEQADAMTKAFLTTKSIGGLVENLFMVAVLPAIGEELLFRGVLQKLIQKMTGSSHWAIWITAIIFSALHLQFFGFLPRLLLGALFGYLLEWTGTLWLPIIAHFINNASGVIMFFITGEGLEPDKPDAPIFNNSVFFGAIVCGAMVWLLMRYLYSKRIGKQAVPELNC